MTSLLQVPGTVAAGHLRGSCSCRVPPSTRPHTAAEGPAHTPPCRPAYPVTSACPLHPGCVSPEEEEEPQPPREVFSLFVFGPSVRSGTLRILETICVPGPWAQSRKDHPIRLGLVWSGEPTHHQQTSGHILGRALSRQTALLECPLMFLSPPASSLLPAANSTPGSISKFNYFLKRWESFRIQYLSEIFAVWNGNLGAFLFNR